MNTFSLLSSSTRIAKKAGPDPSSGSTETSDRKRKRPTPPGKYAFTEDRQSAGHSTVAGGERKQGVVDHNVLPENALPDSSSLQVSTSIEERRSVLKSHKIKIAELWTPSETSTNKRKRNADSKPAKRKGNIVPEPLTHFNQLQSRYGVSKALALNLDHQDFTIPTEVQLASLPLLLDQSTTGEANDARPITPACHVLSVAPTGSGKTLAFLIPVMQSIIRTRQRRKQVDIAAPPGPSALILAPTKELAKQIVSEARKLAHMTGIRTTLVAKGTNLAPPEGQGHAADDDHLPVVKADILVSTPQALLNAAKQSEDASISFPTVSMLILDEADVLLDPLFRDQTLSVWTSCTHANLQISLWSATMGSNIEAITRTTIAQRAPPSQLPLHRLVVGLKDSSIPTIDHRLIYAASERGKLLALRQLLHSNPSHPSLPPLNPPFLVFTQTIPRAIALHAELRYDIPPEAGGPARLAVLHADLSDKARDDVMARFRTGAIWILITTDLLARGVDFKGVNAVVNYDLPTSSAAYVHRAGRTGRAGKGGVAITLYAEEDLPFVKNVANVIARVGRGENGQGAGSGGGDAVTDNQWILENLPKVTKKDKQRLKQKGVESRRRRPDEKGEPRKGGSKRTQISTKSAFERREENKKKAAVEASRKRRAKDSKWEVDGGDGEGEEGFEGFD